MSASDEAEAAADMMSCASCGIAEIDDIKLKKCADCDLVRYCSDKCQAEHRPKHERACTERVAELRDEILFKQPESSNIGDCPICFLPLPINADKSILFPCCSKAICNGCDYANKLREEKENLRNKCPFCRHPMPTSRKEVDLNQMKRIAANDPMALLVAGGNLYNKGEYNKSFEYWTKAAELGNVDAHYSLFNLYRNGYGVEEDEKKEIYHLEEAAIASHVRARYNLGCVEWKNDRIDRAVKHFIIAANLGLDDSIQVLKEFYVNGDVSKEGFAAALRAHQAAVDATKSPQREAAAKAEASRTADWSK